MLYDEIMSFIDSKDIKSFESEYPHYTKYFNSGRYIKQRIQVCNTLDLDKKSKLDILDISSGFGHFPLVCKFMGHNVKVTDVPNPLYDRVTKLFGLEKKYMNISKAGEINIPYDNKFDLISAFAVVPLSFFDDDAWFLFLQTCFNQIRDGGYMYLSPNQGGINGLHKFLETERGMKLYDFSDIRTKQQTVVRKK